MSAPTVRLARLGALWGVSLYLGALALHGGVRERRGCVVDSPLYEIVNGPVLLLSRAGLPLTPESFGELPPLGWTARPGPRFDGAALVALGILFWGLMGAAVPPLVRRIARRRA